MPGKRKAYGQAKKPPVEGGRAKKKSNPTPTPSKRAYEVANERARFKRKS